MSSLNFKKWFMELARQEYNSNGKQLLSQIHKLETFIATKQQKHNTKTPDNIFGYLGIDRVS